MKPDNPLHKTKEWTSIREFFSEWGKKGGAARSDVKTAAVRANAKGGQ
jgi:hypothetical protein